MIRGRVLVAGRGVGRVLRLDADTSFWGAVDPASGVIMDRRHPQHGECLGGRILLLRRSIGSSSGSAILLELLERGCGPAGIILGEPDLILTLGAVVAREMAYASIPVLQLDAGDSAGLDGTLALAPDGSVEPVPDPG
jgi:predicted aconitase with swiveling domain